MPVTKIKSNWEKGNLIFRNTAGKKMLEINSEVGNKVTVKIPLTTGNANAYSFAWQNPESTKIIVDRVIVNITTAGGTSGSVIDVGIAVNATTASDTLIDGADLNTTGLKDNISEAGTNGKSRGLMDEKGGTNDHITGRILTQNAALLAGNVYISYFVI
jgi:phage-related protein